MKALLFAAFATIFMSTEQVTNQSAEKSRATAQYYFTLATDDPMAENEETNWVELDGQDGGCNQSGQYLCTIEAPIGSDGHPDFSGIDDVRTSAAVDVLSYKP